MSVNVEAHSSTPELNPELWQIKSEDSVTADYDVVVVIAYHHQRHYLTSRVCDIHNKGYASKNKHRGRFTENR